jgi:hypothetical protein
VRLLHWCALRLILILAFIAGILLSPFRALLRPKPKLDPDWLFKREQSVLKTMMPVKRVVRERESDDPVRDLIDRR